MNHDEFNDFKPVDFLSFACELDNEILDNGSLGSSVKRTIFSRSYYSVFLTVRELLKRNTEYISNPFGEHRRIANYIEFKGPFDDKLNKKVAKYLRILKKLRVQSDYFLEIPLIGTKDYDDWLFYNTDYAISVAKNLIDLFEKHFNN